MREWRPEFIPAYISNGVLGLRVGHLPLLEGVCIVNGLAAIEPTDGIQAFARGPYPIAGDIELNGHRLALHPERARFVEQRYDFSCGELATRFRFEADGVTAEVEVLTFCSRTLPTAVLQEIAVRVDGPCRLAVRAAVDPASIGGVQLQRDTSTPGAAEPVVDGSLLWETHGELSRCGAAYTTRFLAGGFERSRETENSLAPLATTYTGDAEPERCYRLRQIACLVASQAHIEPHREAVRLAAMATARGFDEVRRENRDAWRELWRGRPVLLGAEARWQAIADASFYYLQASSHSSSLASTSMFGLAYWPNYHYYRGQVMWDVEAFAFPPLLLTQPDAARALLKFRRRGLPAAAMNAALNGYRGFQFPWAASPVTGDEAIRLSAPMLGFEQHVSMAVAHAFALEGFADGDDNRLRESAWPVLEGVATWLESRTVETGRGREITEAIGVAEVDHPVDNNAYVNMTAAVVLREAAVAARRLGRPQEAERWEQVAASLRVPMDEAGRVILNHDGYEPKPGDPMSATPEALAALFPFGWRAEPEVEQSTLRFYLDRIEPYLGHPMLCALAGTWAAWLGERERSRDLFEAGYGDYVNQPYLEINEYSNTRFPDKPVVGPLMANLGGFLLGCYLGLPGLSPVPAPLEQWPRRPVVMPSGWDGVEVERVFAGRREVHLLARHGDAQALLD